MNSRSPLGFELTTNPNPNDKGRKRILDLGNGSEVIYISRFLPCDESWKWLGYLDKEIPWTRPLIRVFGRSCTQQRDTCYIASEGLPELRYSGYQPRVYSWDDFPPLKIILDAVHEALPGSSFNSLLLNRYKSGSDYVAWHSDDEKLYGPTPEIASVSFGCERDFLLKKKPSKALPAQSTSRRLMGKSADHHSFMLKHGSLFVMRGHTQRDWLHSVPKRVKAGATRINLTFRNLLAKKAAHADVVVIVLGQQAFAALYRHYQICLSTIEGDGYLLPRVEDIKRQPEAKGIPIAFAHAVVEVSVK